jgi:citrate synthase
MTDGKPEVLFEITKENLETGMRGYPIGYCSTSTVDPEKGLFYCSRSLQELVEWEPEKVIYLLYYGKEPSQQELQSFISDLRTRAPCSPELGKRIRMLPQKGHPMKLFSAALLVCGMLEGKGDYREDALNLIAKVPEIAAHVINYHAGWGETHPSKPQLGYIENFVQMLRLPQAPGAKLTKALKLFNILHYDHGGGNLSTFVGKAVASSLEDLYGSMAAAMCALAGPRHGKANEDSLEFLQKVIAALGKKPAAEEVEAFVRKTLAQNELVFGFGHAVLRVEDPRAAVLYATAESWYPEDPLIRTAGLLRKEAPKVLGENPKIADPYANVDAISGPLLWAAGFPYPHYFTVLFGMARTVGISVQIVYERCEARGGKGTPIIRPKYLFKKRE